MAKGVVLIGGGALGSLLVAALVYGLAGRYLVAAGQRPVSLSQATGQCRTAGAIHRVTIEDGRVRPQHTQAAKCDTLTITNADAQRRLMAFGQHEHHLAYDGITERLLGTGQSFSVVLNQSGNFTFHDHYDEVVAGSFTVR